MFIVCVRYTAMFKLIPLLCTHVYSYMFSTVHPTRVVRMYVLASISDVEDIYMADPFVYHGNVELAMWNWPFAVVKKILLRTVDGNVERMTHISCACRITD